MKKIFKNIYLERRFFIVLSSLVLGFLISYMVPDILGALELLFFIFVLIFLVDIILVFASKGSINAERQVPEKLSNGDENEIGINILNSYLFPVGVKILDEIPHQFQKRDFGIETILGKGKAKAFQYYLRPTERGVYSFGNLNIFARSPIGLISKKHTFDNAREVPVYPSFLQLRKYDLMAFTNRLFEYGLKENSPYWAYHGV